MKHVALFIYVLFFCFVSWGTVHCVPDVVDFFKNEERSAPLFGDDIKAAIEDYKESEDPQRDETLKTALEAENHEDLVGTAKTIAEFPDDLFGKYVQADSPSAFINDPTVMSIIVAEKQMDETLGAERIKRLELLFVDDYSALRGQLEGLKPDQLAQLTAFIDEHPESQKNDVAVVNKVLELTGVKISDASKQPVTLDDYKKGIMTIVNDPRFSRGIAEADLQEEFEAAIDPKLPTDPKMRIDVLTDIAQGLTDVAKENPDDKQSLAVLASMRRELASILAATDLSKITKFEDRIALLKSMSDSKANAAFSSKSAKKGQKSEQQLIRDAVDEGMIEAVKMRDVIGNFESAAFTLYQDILEWRSWLGQDRIEQKLEGTLRDNLVASFEREVSDKKLNDAEIDELVNKLKADENLQTYVGFISPNHADAIWNAVDERARTIKDQVLNPFLTKMRDMLSAVPTDRYWTDDEKVKFLNDVKVILPADPVVRLRVLTSFGNDLGEKALAAKDKSATNFAEGVGELAYAVAETPLPEEMAARLQVLQIMSDMAKSVFLYSGKVPDVLEPALVKGFVDYADVIKEQGLTAEARFEALDGLLKTGIIASLRDSVQREIRSGIAGKMSEAARDVALDGVAKGMVADAYAQEIALRQDLNDRYGKDLSTADKANNDARIKRVQEFIDVLKKGENDRFLKAASGREIRVGGRNGLTALPEDIIKSQAAELADIKAKLQDKDVSKPEQLERLNKLLEDLFVIQYDVKNPVTQQIFKADMPFNKAIGADFVLELDKVRKEAADTYIGLINDQSKTWVQDAKSEDRATLSSAVKNFVRVRAIFESEAFTIAGKGLELKAKTTYDTVKNNLDVVHEKVKESLLPLDRVIALVSDTIIVLTPEQITRVWTLRKEFEEAKTTKETAAFKEMADFLATLRDKNQGRSIDPALEFEVAMRSAVKPIDPLSQGYLDAQDGKSSPTMLRSLLQWFKDVGNTVAKFFVGVFRRTYDPSRGTDVKSTLTQSPLETMDFARAVANDIGVTFDRGELIVALTMYDTLPSLHDQFPGMSQAYGVINAAAKTLTASGQTFKMPEKVDLDLANIKQDPLLKEESELWWQDSFKTMSTGVVNNVVVAKEALSKYENLNNTDLVLQSQELINANRDYEVAKQLMLINMLQRVEDHQQGRKRKENPQSKFSAWADRAVSMAQTPEQAAAKEQEFINGIKGDPVQVAAFVTDLFDYTRGALSDFAMLKDNIAKASQEELPLDTADRNALVAGIDLHMQLVRERAEQVLGITQ